MISQRIVDGVEILMDALRTRDASGDTTTAVNNLWLIVTSTSYYKTHIMDYFELERRVVSSRRV